MLRYAIAGALLLVPCSLAAQEAPPLRTGMDGTRRCTVPRRHSHVLGVSGVLSCPQDAQFTAQKLAIGDTEFTSSAAAKGVETNPIPGFDVSRLCSGFGDDAGAISSQDVRQRHFPSGETAPDADIDMIQRRRFELNNRFRRRSKFKFRCIFIS